jgi:hypothetical protein
VDCDIHDPPQWEGGAKAEGENRQMGGATMKPTMTPTMTEYRIVELNRMFSIEVKKGKEWGDLNLYGVPRFFDSLADARSWVATIKKGVVYHDAEDAPNLPVDERKAESGVKISDEWEQAITSHISTLLRERGLVNGIEIYSVTVDDNHIRIYT